MRARGRECEWRMLGGRGSKLGLMLWWRRRSGWYTMIGYIEEKKGIRNSILACAFPLGEALILAIFDHL